MVGERQPFFNAPMACNCLNAAQGELRDDEGLLAGSMGAAKKQLEALKLNLKFFGGKKAGEEQEVKKDGFFGNLFGGKKEREKRGEKEGSK